ncbi:hypothetical protein F751_4292 [Auxenochlorella protothecoides]|uniref:Uncharacterized protein n=1 Tax=Auxenochlorella protothecoides TaxID=3075 RepID=A0A087SA94_AUXPR|nr:hypothetical protein F751_4292 [Auxenochlorella protothecoides]KFM22648.1 hypothetical protein F751_4292 [Auxenochlorella protothecoides]
MPGTKLHSPPISNIPRDEVEECIQRAQQRKLLDARVRDGEVGECLVSSQADAADECAGLEFGEAMSTQGVRGTPCEACAVLGAAGRGFVGSASTPGPGGQGDVEVLGS